MSLRPVNALKNQESELTMILETAKKVIQAEIKALHALLTTVDHNLEKAARLIQTAQERVVVTGVGKSGHIGRKIAATLN